MKENQTKKPQPQQTEFKMKNTTPKDPIQSIRQNTKDGYISYKLVMSLIASFPEEQKKTVRAMPRRDGCVYSPAVIRIVKGLWPAKTTERSAKQKLWFTKDQIEALITEMQKHEVRGRIHRLTAARICYGLNRSLGHYIGKPPKRLSHFYKSGKLDCFIAGSLYAFLREYIKPEPEQKQKKDEVIPMFSSNDWINQMVELGRAPVLFFICESNHPGEGKVAYLCCPVAESLAEQIHKALGK